MLFLQPVNVTWLGTAALLVRPDDIMMMSQLASTSSTAEFNRICASGEQLLEADDVSLPRDRGKYGIALDMNVGPAIEIMNVKSSAELLSPREINCLRNSSNRKAFLRSRHVCSTRPDIVLD
jgi:hypothetical protein